MAPSQKDLAVCDIVVVHTKDKNMFTLLSVANTKTLLAWLKLGSKKDPGKTVFLMSWAYFS